MHTPDYTLLSNPIHREYETEYRKQFAETPLENIIIFRSGPHEDSYVPGMDYADNARALFEYMLSIHLDDKYMLVWLVKNPAEFTTTNQREYFAEDGSVQTLSVRALDRNQSFKNRNIHFIAYEWAVTDNIENRNAYYEAMCKAKYIFMTDAYGFAGACRSDQIRIQLWHGCGFKTRVNFSPCENRYEYNIVISEKYRQIHRDIYGLRDDQVVITGYPKQDWLHQPYEESLSKLVGCVDADKYIFWLPTFRMAKDQLSELNQYDLNTETGLPIVGTSNQLEQLNELLVSLDICLVIKLHPFQKKNLAPIGDYSNITLLYNEELVEKDLVINRLLADADALISDYSSVAVDYLSLDRPIAFTLDDVEEYQSSRGFVFENIRDWLPGVELFAFDDFTSFVREIANDVDSSCDKRHKIGSGMNWFHDDKNCERVLRHFNILT